MTCREFIEFLDRYLGDELSPAERAQFDRHLGVCPDCTNYLATYQETVELEQKALAPDDAVPADVPEDLVRAIMSTIAQK